MRRALHPSVARASPPQALPSPNVPTSASRVTFTDDHLLDLVRGAPAQDLAAALEQLTDRCALYELDEDDVLNSALVWAPGQDGSTAGATLGERAHLWFPHADSSDVTVGTRALIEQALDERQTTWMRRTITGVAAIVIGVAPLELGDRPHVLVMTRMTMPGVALSPRPLAEGLLTVGQDGVIVGATPAARRILTDELEDLVGQPVLTLQRRFLGADGKLMDAGDHPLRRLVAGEQFADLLVGYVPPAGDGREPERRWLLLHAGQVAEHGPLVLGMIDATERVEDEQALASSEARFRLLTSRAPIGVVQLDLDGRIVFCNHKVESIFGVGRDEAAGSRWMDFLDPADLSAWQAAWQRARQTASSFDHSARVKLGEDVYRRVNISLAPVLDDDERLQSFIGTIVDDSQLVALRARLSRAERRAALIGENMSDIFARVSFDGQILEISPAVRSVLGWREEQLEGDALTTLVHPDDRRELDALTDAARGDLKADRPLVRLLSAEDQYVPVLVAASHVVDPDSRTDELWAVISPAAERRPDSGDGRDPVSGLMSWRAFSSAVEDRRVASGGHGVMVLADIDRFDELNLQLGSDTGDAVLRALADRVRRRFGDEALAARQADAVLLFEAGAGAERGEQLGRELQALCDRPFLQGRPLRLTLSVGISAGHRADSMRLRREAELAAAHARERHGLGGCQIFDGALRQRRERHNVICSAVQDAVAAQHTSFLVGFEPQINLATGRVEAVEALMRFDHVTEGRLSPREFLPVVAASGLMVSVDRWATESAVAQAASWDGDHLGLAVNLSVDRLLARATASEILAALDRHGLDARRLTVELPAGAVWDGAGAQRTVDELAGHGVALAAQDLPTFQALTCAGRVQLSQLKLDPELIGGYGRDAAASAIVDGAMLTARSLGISVCAVGVEDAELLHGVQQLGCDHAQGCLFAADLLSAMAVGRQARTRRWRVNLDVVDV